MTNSKTKADKSSTIHTLRIILPLVAWVAFLFSFVFPFYRIDYPFAEWGWEVGSIPTHYWSHKFSFPLIEVTHWNEPPKLAHDEYYWFDSLWFRNRFVVENGLSWVFVSMFVAQSLVLASGLISVYTDRKKLSFIPMVLSTLVVILMTVVGISFSKVSRFSSFEIGYWQSLLSLSLFTASYILKMKNSARTNTSPAPYEKEKELFV